MRLISQDGTIDVPYEQISVEQKGNEIWCGYSSTMVKHCMGKKLAEYSNKFRISQDTIQSQSLMEVRRKQEVSLYAMSAVKSIIAKIYMRHIRELRSRN